MACVNIGPGPKDKTQTYVHTERWCMYSQLKVVVPRVACMVISSGFPGGSGVKNPRARAGEAGSIPGSGRPPGEGNGNPPQYPLQYSCLENLMNSIKRQKDRTLKDELPWSVGAQYTIGEQCKNNSRKKEETELKKKTSCGCDW